MLIVYGTSPQFDYHGPLNVIWFYLGLILLLGVLSYFLPVLWRRENQSPDRFWKANIFYVNRDDPALFVAKRFGIGYTLNFGNPWSWLVLGLIMLVSLAPVVFAFYSFHIH